MIRVKAPSKILWTLRFKNRCMNCGRVIAMNKTLCLKCYMKLKKQKLF